MDNEFDILNEKDSTDNSKAVKKFIKDYVKQCLKDQTPILKKKQIIDYLTEKNLTGGFTPNTLYTYMRELNINKGGDGTYKIQNKSITLDSLLNKGMYNKTTFFRISDPTYGKLIAKRINSYYDSIGDIIHCEALGEILICFYYFKKNDKDSSFTQKETFEFIKKCLEQNVLTLSSKSY